MSQSSPHELLGSAALALLRRRAFRPPLRRYIITMLEGGLGERLEPTTAAGFLLLLLIFLYLLFRPLCVCMCFAKCLCEVFSEVFPWSISRSVFCRGLWAQLGDNIYLFDKPPWPYSRWKIRSLWYEMYAWLKQCLWPSQVTLWQYHYAITTPYLWFGRPCILYRYYC